MKRRSVQTIFGVSVALISLVGVPAYGGRGGHGGGGGFSGGGHAGFSGGARAGGYSGAGMGRGFSNYGVGRYSSPPNYSGSYGARNYSPGISTGRYGSYHGYGQRSYAPRATTGRQLYAGSRGTSQNRTVSKQFARSPNYSGSYYVPRNQSGTSFTRKPGIQQRTGTTAKGSTRAGTTWSRQNVGNRHRLDPQTTDRLRNWQGKAPGYGDARRHHQEHWRDRHHHDHDWWRHHCDAIVLVGLGYWGWYDGWWYPAWGYDPYYSYYDYNGPIYGYGGLQPDEVIANVQAALQQLGYYPYAIDGVFGTMTEAAIANYQRDYGLSVTGGIDPPTVRSLGLGG